ncbi:DNA adenine methylase [Enterococcus faecium]|nr:Dam family site-specific DNA-(adenine-N6)-methyltransferase [Enterococcus faecium]EGP4760269.1 Dam family site-specific DNA-(adenine-N6)-methyltransferase [Enterococcus faecium]EGP5689179.1 Dam family site-specific DNA-(adenine-N6)-methyltransferase [Enterococcus faecium]EJB5627402.1 Dam family site-specific DNA-(adenine-N6)-methyltransferase [Enterococcus faecium]MBE9858377.1 Dam family site-specific DNA-(adenine-N6)-methyltransferase [Enterococcus faecium]MBE9881758.1 Dam family site-spec
MNEDILRVKPFLRWAGGKSWLKKHLYSIIGDLKFNNYFEPFLGGASIFLAIQPKNQVYLSDLNKELIGTYCAIKNDPYAVIKELKKYENTEKFYYEMRSKVFDDNILSAAQFIYLNKTSYNGIYRVNRSGGYNVPYGYRPTYTVEEDNILMVSKLLTNATLRTDDFMSVKSKIQKNDLVILDPPYTVSHNENGFISYNQKLFSLEDQYRLRELIDYIKEMEAYYILTNAAHEKIFEIFNIEDDFTYPLTRASLIGGKNANRGKVKEFVFTNIKEI